MKKHDFSFTLSDGAIILPKYVSKTESKKVENSKNIWDPWKFKKMFMKILLKNNIPT